MIGSKRADGPRLCRRLAAGALSFSFGLVVMPGALAGPPAEPHVGSKGGTAFPAAAVAKPVVYEYPRVQPKIARAIQRGVAYLKKVEDFRVGGRALAGLTLLSCGVGKNDPAVTRSARAVRAGLPQLTATYELSMCLLFLDKLGDPKDHKLIRRIALQLAAGQGILGGWNYRCFTLSSRQEKQLLELLRAPVRWAPAGEVFAPKPAADFRLLPVLQYRPGQELLLRPTTWEDNSLTQFVILALWAAQRHGVPAERSLAMVEARFRASQGADGSWAYHWRPDSHFRADSMTCAGLLGLAVGNGSQILHRKPAEAQQALRDPAVEKALVFLSQRIGAAGPRNFIGDKLKANVQLLNLQQQFAVAGPAQRPAILKEIQGVLKEQNDVQVGGTILGANARGDLYFLWSVERVAVTYDLRTIGGKDWYAWGAPLILSHQQADGSWNDMFPGVPDTCFALLFLQRVNVAKDLSRQLQNLMLSPQAAGRMDDPYHGMSPGEFATLGQAKGRR